MKNHENDHEELSAMYTIILFGFCWLLPQLCLFSKDEPFDRSFATHKPHLCQFLHMLILGQLQDLKHLIYTMFENHKSSHICNPFGFVHNNFSLQFFFCNLIISISRVFLCPASSYVKYIKLQHLCSIRDAKNCVKFVKCTASLTNLTCALRTTMFCQKIMQKTLRKSKAESTRFSTFSL